MPAPMLKGSFGKMTNKLKTAAKHVAEASMSSAADQLRGDAETSM